MNESAFTGKLLRALRQHPALAGAVIFKHNDYYTGGIPDFSVTLKGLTTWFEIKIRPNVCTSLQSYYLKKLAPRAYLIIVEPDGKAACIMPLNTGMLVFSNLVEAIVIRCKI